MKVYVNANLQKSFVSSRLPLTEKNTMIGAVLTLCNYVYVVMVAHG